MSKLKLDEPVACEAQRFDLGESARAGGQLVNYSSFQKCSGTAVSP